MEEKRRMLNVFYKMLTTFIHYNEYWDQFFYVLNSETACASILIIISRNKNNFKINQK
jgi:hypothetical protein